MNNPGNDYKLAYRAKMKDPRWIRFRDKTISDRECRCEECGGEATSVHHIAYLRGHEPWEYPPDLVLALCWPCHQQRQGHDEDAKAEFGRLLGRLTSAQVYELTKGIRATVDGCEGRINLFDAFEAIVQSSK